MINKLERKHESLAPRSVFFARLLRSFLVAQMVVAGSLLIGTCGYHWLGHLGWVDAVYNAGMILTGMGPVDRMESTAGKLFATGYALFSGVVLLSLVAVMFAPIYHRFLHHFHLESGRKSD
ncbi:MAG: hypothetical protein ACJ8F7_20835 [Gemmataceae bacterium]